jgi:hypothetical protein
MASTQDPNANAQKQQEEQEARAQEEEARRDMISQILLPEARERREPLLCWEGLQLNVFAVESLEFSWLDRNEVNRFPT